MVFKCKMCGGDVEVIKGTNTGKCLYCKSTMTLPISDNEKIINLYNRANDLRLDNEFDKAIEIYEEILKIDNNQVEAHWGLILCKYGVEYVDDPKTKKKIPTCHRTSDSSIFSDRDYKFIIKNAYGEALELYRKQAKEINDIQKGILEISSLEEPYDIFICYKETDENGDRTKDSVIAQDIYDELVKNNYRVFFSRITLEDKLGTEYEPYIYSALKSSKIMIVVGTCFEHLDAVWVKNEWSRYIDFLKKDKSKTIIPVYSQMDAYDLPDSLAMYQSQNMDKLGAMQDLIHGINKIMGKKQNVKGELNEETIEKLKKMLEKEDKTTKKKTRKKINIKPFIYFGASILLIILAVWALIKLSPDSPSKNPKQEVKTSEQKEEKIVTEEITEGEIEGYKFKETDEITKRVKIQMQNGDIILIVLSNADTPITIANFQKLVSEHFYDGLTFHRIVKDFMIQTGDPNGNGTGGSDEEIKGEFKLNGVENNLSHTRGVISMARRGGNPETADTMNSASSQFFIVHQDSTFLDGNYAAFGKVFAGMDVVDKLAETEVLADGETPVVKPVIKSIRFIEIEKVS